jgi:hypothetical protein
MYLKFSMDPYPNSVHEDHLKHKAPKINVQNSTHTQFRGTERMQDCDHARTLLDLELQFWMGGQSIILFLTSIYKGYPLVRC